MEAAGTRTVLPSRVSAVCSPAVDAFRDKPTPSTWGAVEVREIPTPSTPSNSVNCPDFFKKMKALGLRRGQSET